MNDWFDWRAELFLQDRAGCANDPWTVKSRCAHCLAALLRDVAERARPKAEPREETPLSTPKVLLCRGGSGRAVWRVADFGEQGRSEMQPLAEMEAGWVEREVHGHGPELQLIASAAAAVAEEHVLADVANREAGVGSVVRRVERAGTTPLVTTDVEGGVVQFFKHRTDGDLSAQGAVVETRHARDFTGAWGN